MAARHVSGTAACALWLGLALVVILLDQFTKTLILGYFQLGDSRHVTSFFNLVRVHNTGAAFSFLAGASGWQRWFFVALGLVASGFIVWMLRSHPAQKLFCFAVTMIMGGALGNVIDRLLHGYVVDFIQVHRGRLVLPELQPRRQRHHAGRGICLIARRDPARAPRRAERR